MSSCLFALLSLLASACSAWVGAKVIANLVVKSLNKPPHAFVVYMCGIVFGLISGCLLAEIIGLGYFLRLLTIVVVALAAVKFLPKLIDVSDNESYTIFPSSSDKCFNMPLKLVSLVLCSIACLAMNTIVKDNHGLVASLVSMTLGTFIVSFVITYVLLGGIFLFMIGSFIYEIVFSFLEQAFDKNKATYFCQVIASFWSFFCKFLSFMNKNLNRLGDYISSLPPEGESSEKSKASEKIN